MAKRSLPVLILVSLLVMGRTPVPRMAAGRKGSFQPLVYQEFTAFRPATGGRQWR